MKRHSLFAASTLATMILVGISVLGGRRFVIGLEPTGSGTMAPVKPTSTAPIQSEPVVIFSTVLHHLFNDPQGTPGREVVGHLPQPHSLCGNGCAEWRAYP